MKYLIVDILILVLMYILYIIGKQGSHPRNPADVFWDNKYDEIKRKIMKDAENK